ncbi:hypothetical protein HW115_18720 [Verrucomicrobiaceae bacterium N1E253]|uniref:Uncharacterized protein n=1 Tax=Oceaniferula marina TaxID=2748318 RepID=A0A851GIM7_9BACT|nr:hypothetical protein [Oceaniferula marina]NWK57658.1 hypothetical protein [Oceaniferula marina]
MNELKELITAAIDSMQKKQEESYEAIIESYLGSYRSILQQIDDFEIIDLTDHRLSALKGNGRGYLETSSNWKQPFLYKMGDVETYLNNQ